MKEVHHCNLLIIIDLNIPVHHNYVSNYIITHIFRSLLNLIEMFGLVLFNNFYNNEIEKTIEISVPWESHHPSLTILHVINTLSIETSDF